MVLPAGNKRQMECQEYLHKQAASGQIVEAMLRKMAELDITRDPLEMANTLSAPPQQQAPAQPNVPPDQSVDQPGVQDVMNRSNTLPQPNNSKPIKAQPSDTVVKNKQDLSQDPQWKQLAAALSPFLEERNLRVMDNLRMIDPKKNVYELLLGPKLDPLTGEQMKLPDATEDELYADSELIAQKAGGRVEGLPRIDEKMMWHIPLQLGGMKVNKP